MRYDRIDCPLGPNPLKGVRSYGSCVFQWTLPHPGQKQTKIQGKMQARVKGRNLFFEVILFDLCNIRNIELIVSQSTEKAKKPSVF